MEFLTPSLKTPVVLGEPIRAFHHSFFSCFYFITDFYYCWLHLFISPTLGFFITISLGVSISPLIFTDLRKLFLFSCNFYLTLLPHICHRTASATDLRELSCSQAFFTLHSGHLAQRDVASHCIYHGFPRSRAVLLWRLQGLPLRFQTQTRPICLFESYNGQQNVLVGRFYLCAKALGNTISPSSRFWTRYFIFGLKLKCHGILHYFRSTDLLINLLKLFSNDYVNIYLFLIFVSIE